MAGRRRERHPGKTSHKYFGRITRLQFPAGLPPDSVVIVLPQRTNLCLESSSKNCGRNNGSACANFAWSTATTPATGAKSNGRCHLHAKDEDTLRKWAKQLGVKPGTADWHKFHDYAAVDAGRIPDHLLEDKELAAHLPVFFRTLSGQKPSREDLEKLLKLIRSANKP